MASLTNLIRLAQVENDSPVAGRLARVPRRVRRISSPMPCEFSVRSPPAAAETARSGGYDRSPRCRRRLSPSSMRGGCWPARRSTRSRNGSVRRPGRRPVSGAFGGFSHRPCRDNSRRSRCRPSMPCRRSGRRLSWPWRSRDLRYRRHGHCGRHFRARHWRPAAFSQVPFSSRVAFRGPPPGCVRPAAAADGRSGPGSGFLPVRPRWFRRLEPA